MERYQQRSQTSWFVVGTYLFLVGIIGILGLARDLTEAEVVVLAAVLLIYLARIVSTRYAIRDGYLHTTRLFGSRRVRLASISKATESSLRDLSPVSWTGGWGWRSRMWSPVIGPFDNLSTVHTGLVIFGEGVPFFISPVDRAAFLSELDARCGNRLLSKSGSS